MKKHQKQLHDAGRRDFLRDSAAAGAGAAIAATLPVTGSIAGELQPEKVQEGYRLTDHIIAYYKTTVS